MAGIQRIVIKNPKEKDWRRYRDARRRWPACYRIYREIFARLGMPLSDGVKEIECTAEDAFGRLDRKLGIDVIFKWPIGMQATLQEKFLFTSFGTATVEYMNDPNIGDEGDWFHLMANYYFVGYSKPKELDFWSWRLLDWAALQRETIRGNITWGLRYNWKSPAKANFKYVRFDEIPQNCIIATSEDLPMGDF